MFRQIGVGGESLISSYNDEETRVDDIGIEDLRRMIHNDGQVRMLYNSIVNTILSAGSHIEDDKDIEGDEKSTEYDFINEVIYTSIYKGGMSRPLELTNSIMLRALVDGFRVFEVVYKIREDQKITLDKLAPRAATNDEDFKLVVDKKGNWIGYHQTVPFKNTVTNIKVLNTSEIKKVVKATFGEEFGTAYGKSALLAPWYHYDKAHKGMYLNHVGHELGAVKFRYLQTKGCSDEEITAALDALARVHQESIFTAPEEKMTLTFEDVSDAGIMAEGREMINLHYSSIAKSFLAQFIDLGSSMSSTGSRATADTHVDFFKDGLQITAKILIENVWNEVIADLIKMNFGSDTYPTFKVNPISNKKAEAIFNVFLEMAKSGKIGDSMKQKLLEQTSEDLELGVTEEEIASDMIKEEQMEMKQQEAMNKAPQNPKAKKELSDDMESSMVVRPLYPDEQKVRILDIKRELDNTKVKAESILREKLSIQKGVIIDDYVEAVREGRDVIRDVKIKLADMLDSQSKYSEELDLLIISLMEYAKTSAANEMEKAVPNTPNSKKKAMKASIAMTIKKQENDLMFRLSSVAQESLEMGLPENDTKLRLENEYDAFWRTSLALALGILIGKALNKGRQVTFDKYQKDIFAYRYTAIIDGRTTDYCMALDGRVFQANDPQFAMLTPPNHYRCRSFWTEILKTESAGVIVNGKPGELPTFSSVNTFRNVDSVADLSSRENELDHLLNMIDG